MYHKVKFYEILRYRPITHQRGFEVLADSSDFTTPSPRRSFPGVERPCTRRIANELAIRLKRRNKAAPKTYVKIQGGELTNIYPENEAEWPLANCAKAVRCERERNETTSKDLT